MLFDRRDVLTGLLVAGASPSAFGKSAVGTPTTAEAQALHGTLLHLMAKFGLPAISAAVAFKGRVLWADAIGASPSSLFRIASVSKPITAVTVLEMISNPPVFPAIGLYSKVFGPGGLLAPYFPDSTFCDRRFADITVEQLLSHRSGCPSNASFTIAASNLPAGPVCASDVQLSQSDNQTGIGYKALDPMTLPAWRGKSQDELITAVLENMRLQFDPGTAYAYSNFGYLLLGRIIEHYAPRTVSQGGRIGSMSYADAVRAFVLGRIGIQDMAIALPGTQLRPGEVAYFGGSGMDAYAENVVRMDSHGGWLATPSDLVNFAWNGVDLLKPKMRQEMAKVRSLSPGAPAGYALGWNVNVRDCNLFHSGYLIGTESFLVRSASGFTIAYVTNKNPPDYTDPSTNKTVSLVEEFDGLWGTLLGQVSTWQAQRFNRLSASCPT